MEIGALLVGKISNYKTKNAEKIFVGQEKGYFEYGGSTIVVLTKKRVDISTEIVNKEKVGDEIPIRIGEKLI